MWAVRCCMHSLTNIYNDIVFGIHLPYEMRWFGKWCFAYFATEVPSFCIPYISTNISVTPLKNVEYCLYLCEIYTALKKYIYYVKVLVIL